MFLISLVISISVDKRKGINQISYVGSSPKVGALSIAAVVCGVAES